MMVSVGCIQDCVRVLVQGGISASPLQVLCGHHDSITCVAIVTELDMAVSGSKVASLLFVYVEG